MGVFIVKENHRFYRWSFILVLAVVSRQGIGRWFQRHLGAGKAAAALLFFLLGGVILVV